MKTLVQYINESAKQKCMTDEYANKLEKLTGLKLSYSETREEYDENDNKELVDCYNIINISSYYDLYLFIAHKNGSFIINYDDDGFIDYIGDYEVNFDDPFDVDAYFELNDKNAKLFKLSKLQKLIKKIESNDDEEDY